jgi:DNA-binding response OmpR family regulator
MQLHRPPVFPSPLAFGQPAQALARLAGARVLVVEDNEDSRQLICMLLEMSGATVLCTESVAKAMDGVYHSFDPDVVLSDFSMPGEDGLDLIREFRKAPSARAVAVPVLILSGHTEEDWRARVLAAGAVDVITKPFDPDLLISRIAAAVGRGPF